MAAPGCGEVCREQGERGQGLRGEQRAVGRRRIHTVRGPLLGSGFFRLRRPKNITAEALCPGDPSLLPLGHIVSVYLGPVRVEVFCVLGYWIMGMTSAVHKRILLK